MQFDYVLAAIHVFLWCRPRTKDSLMRWIRSSELHILHVDDDVREWWFYFTWWCNWKTKEQINWKVGSIIFAHDVFGNTNVSRKSIRSFWIFHWISNKAIFKSLSPLELIVLENAYHGDNKYRLEDFFWTGSGDGATDDDNPWSTEKPSTIYKTKTIVSTVYIENPATPENPVFIIFFNSTKLLSLFF